MTRRRRLTAALLLPVGLLASHSLAYLFAGADPHVSGHGGPLHGDTAALGVVAAAAAAVAFRMASRSQEPTQRVASLLITIGAVQGLLYALMEIAERTAHGTPIADAIAEPTLRWGLAIQAVGVALAAALVRIGRAILERRRRPAPPARRRALPALAVARWVPDRPLRSSSSRRGPPLLAVR